jgi:hypothetical protein
MCGDLSPVAMDAIVPGENCIFDIPSKLTECDLLIVFVDVKNIMKITNAHACKRNRCLRTG